MGQNVALYSLLIAITSGLLAVCSAIVCWRTVSRATALRKWLRAQLLTKTSDARLSRIEADQAELFSTLEKVTTTARRLSSRHGMRELREKESSSPPLGSSKETLRKFYGLAGKTPAQVHQMHLLTKGDE